MLLESMQGWELESLFSFLDILYSTKVGRVKENCVEILLKTTIQRLNFSQSFKLKWMPFFPLEEHLEGHSSNKSGFCNMDNDIRQISNSGQFEEVSYNLWALVYVGEVPKNPWAHWA